MLLEDGLLSFCIEIDKEQDARGYYGIIIECKDGRWITKVFA